MIHLSNSKSKEFVSECLLLVKAFGEHNERRFEQLNNPSINKTVRNELEELQVKEISTLLNLIDQLSTKDLIDNNNNNSVFERRNYSYNKEVVNVV